MGFLRRFKRRALRELDLARYVEPFEYTRGNREEGLTVGHGFKCPRCGHFIAYKMERCQECGQKLRWRT